MLVGIPGSGKSTISSRFRDKGWVIVSQDELGDRRKCEHASQEALKNGYNVVIDRTNIDETQRSHWLRIARECRLPGTAVAALFLSISVKTCKDRVMSRTGHPTLKPSRSSMGIVDQCFRDLKCPSEQEGFGRVVVFKEGDCIESSGIVDKCS